jgi:hypothetical protein
MDYDNSYKLLFSHAEMVADLIRGFVHEPWVAELDFSTLERGNVSYVSDPLEDRHDDIIWRIRWQGQEWLYIYLLLEFQSGVDDYMAVRVLVYILLFYQELIRAKQLPASGRLPPMLPLVLYNGRRPWTASQSLADLIEPAPAGLDRYRPNGFYGLLKEARYSDSQLAPMPNLAAALFQLENSRTPQQFGQVVTALIEWLKSPEQASLARAFLVWMKRVFLPSRLPDTPIPELHTLAEVKAMLVEDEYSVDWTREWKKQGWEEGHKEGRQEMLAAEKALLARRVERRFGADCAATVAAHLEPITDQDRLFDIAEWLVMSPRGEDLLNRFAGGA